MAKKILSWVTAVAIAAVAGGAAGCGKIPLPGGMTPKASQPGALGRAALSRSAFAKGGSWTVLVHMAADNNLYEFALEDINEMEAGLAAMRAKGDKTRFVLLFDGTTNGDSCVYEVVPEAGPVNDKIVSKKITETHELIPASGEIDSGDPRIAAKFAAWGAWFAPADHTILSFWDHGSGIFKNRGATPSKGFCWDDQGGHMETSDLDDITGAFKSSAGKNLTAFAMDACLMSHVELAYQARGTTDFMIASEELEPGHGYDYLDWMKRVAASDKSAVAVLSALVDSCAWAYNGGSYGTEDITFALTNINGLVDQAVPAMNRFAKVANATMATSKGALSAARDETQVFGNSDCADLIHFGELVAASTAPADVKAAAAAMTAALRTVVVREAHSAAYPGARGLVAYFPTAGQSYNKTYDDPARIAFAKEGWRHFLGGMRR